MGLSMHEKAPRRRIGDISVEAPAVPQTIASGLFERIVHEYGSLFAQADIDKTRASLEGNDRLDPSVRPAHALIMPALFPHPGRPSFSTNFLANAMPIFSEANIKKAADNPHLLKQLGDLANRAPCFSEEAITDNTSTTMLHVFVPLAPNNLMSFQRAYDLDHEVRIGQAIELATARGATTIAIDDSLPGFPGKPLEEIHVPDSVRLVSVAVLADELARVSSVEPLANSTGTVFVSEKATFPRTHVAVNEGREPAISTRKLYERITSEVLKIAEQHPEPLLIIDLGRVRENYWRIARNVEGAEIFYAMKANDDPEILRKLAQQGSSFEIASVNELRRLMELNVPPQRIMSLHPIKTPAFIEAMAEYGVTTMAYDSTDEVDKIARHAPGSELVLRIAVDNAGSDWPLSNKFGVGAAEVLPLLRYAKGWGLKPTGLTFHVGSQCRNVNNWVNALSISGAIWSQARQEGIDLSLLSLGGGIPIQHLKKIPSIEEIGDAISGALMHNFGPDGSNLRLTIEPGRGLVGDAGIMAATVIGKAKRGEEEWIFLDVGVFNGLMETIEGFGYEIITPNAHEREIRQVTVAGPSCDSVDVPFKNIQLPEVHTGERVFVRNAGAYTVVYGSQFNGLGPPDSHFLNR